MPLKHLLRRWLGIEKKSRADQVTFVGGDYPRERGGDAVALMETLHSNPWVYAALYAIGSAPAQVPYGIRSSAKAMFSDAEEEGDDSEKVDGYAHVELLSAARRFVAKPNPDQNFDDFVMEVLLSLELTGDAYVEWVREGRAAEAYVLRGDRMSIQAARGRRVDAYLYRANGREIRFAPDEIVHVQWPNPNDDLYGLAPVRAAERDLVAEYYAQAYNQNFFKHGARIDGVLQAEGELDDASFQRLKDEWRKAYSGSEQMHRTAVLENGLTYQPIAATPRDMEFQQMRKWNREAVLAALGVPPAMVGVFEYANYANADVQKRMFWEETMLPKLRKLESMFNRLLAHMFSDELTFTFYPDRIPALAAAAAERTAALTGLVDAGILSPTEARRQWRGEERGTMNDE